MKKDDFGNRMKSYEFVETSRKLRNDIPVYVRIDGRGFSKFTKGMNRPFDANLSQAMIATTAYLVEKTHAKIGYTQSDEISLLYDGTTIFDSKIQKLCSILAGMTSAYFMRKCFELLPEHIDKIPHFDCRVFNIPSQSEAVNAFLWRVRDCERNAVSMAAHYKFGHKNLHGKSTGQKREMLLDEGTNFDTTYPIEFRNGTFVVRKSIMRELTHLEMSKIPIEKRPLPGVMFERTITKRISFDGKASFDQLKKLIYG